MAQHKTARGALMAKLDWKKTAAGEYVIEGYGVIMRAEASGSRPGRWEISDADTVITEVPSLTAALQFIDERITEKTLLPASALTPQVETETETVPVEVEVIEPVVAEVQEDAEAPAPAPVPVPAPRKSTKLRAHKTRRSQLLAELGAREINTAEYEVAGHQVMYVAPGVMPRNAGGRWRTTLMTTDGVAINWDLSLTAALEVVAARVAAAVAEHTSTTTSGARRYVAVYTSSRKDVDLCELHADGCSDLHRTTKSTDPQVDVTLDITDEDGTMRVLDPDQLGYDVHAVKVMPCAQRAPLAENANA